MIYKIENKVNKEWNGKPFVEAELVDDQGERFKVSAWSGEFNAVDAWEGELVKNDKGYWKLITKKAIQAQTGKTAQMEKVMAKKEESIGKFQDNKEFQIKVASTMRGAIDLAIANYKQNPSSLRTLEEEVEYWRKYLWNAWEVDITDISSPF